MTKTDAAPLGARLAARLRKPPVLVVLALNLVPAVCVVLFGWNAGVLLLLYWAENVVIGGFNVVKMAGSGLAWGRVGLLMALFLIPFFTFHYGLFCFVHGVFVVVMGLGPQALVQADISPMGLYRLVEEMARTEPGFARSLMAIVAAQSVSFLFDWLIPGGAKRFNPMAQMFAPYPRIILLHFTIFVAAIPVLLLGSPVWAVVALALVKTAFELRGEPEGFLDEKTRRQSDDSVRAAERLWARRRRDG